MKFDVLVIGAGTGGLRTAMTAAHSGKNTCLIGDAPLAGTCLNNGCIPTKAMLHAADVYRTAANGAEVGILAKPKVDFKKLMDRVRTIVRQGRSHATKAVEHQDNLTYIEGRAKFVGKKTVEVNHTRITANTIIIATGTRPFVPPIPGLADVPFITNIEAVQLKKQPKHLVLIGGGYIACEYATFFATIGTKVTIVERAPHILLPLDEDVRKVVQSSLKKMGVTIYTNVATTNVSKNKSSFKLTLSGAPVKTLTCDELLVACGRVPNTEDLNLSTGNIAQTKRGFIKVDRYLRTSEKSVYAIGDINGQALFAHAAKREGWYALEHALLGHKHTLKPQDVPWAMFTHPTVAGIGLSEQQLQKDHTPYDTLVAPFSSCGKAKVIRQAEGFVKVLHIESKILGVQVVGPEADNLVHEFVIAYNAGTHGLDLVSKSVHVHPTLAEVAENLKPRK